jgi:hypothetical protein
MEIILSKFCKSITGVISRSHGYYIKCINGRFYGVRTSRAVVPPDGHWNFILSLTYMALNTGNVFVTDISVSSFELTEALTEASFPPYAIMVLCVPGHVYNAREIMLLKNQLYSYMKSCNHEC